MARIVSSMAQFEAAGGAVDIDGWRTVDARGIQRQFATLCNTREQRAGLAAAFNGFFLEWLEVEIIVITVGSASATRSRPRQPGVITVGRARYGA